MPAAMGRGCVERYQARISGPLLDRIDLQIEVPAVSAADLVLPAASEGSAEVRARVAAARAIQAERFAALKHPRARTNADCDGSLLEDIAAPDSAGRTLLREAADALGLSARGYHRTLRVARTLADLDGEARVARIHIAEALELSRRDVAPRAGRGLKFFSEPQYLGTSLGSVCNIPKLSHSIRIGLLTGACCGRIGAAALLVASVAGSVARPPHFTASLAETWH